MNAEEIKDIKSVFSNECNLFPRGNFTFSPSNYINITHAVNCIVD